MHHTTRPLRATPRARRFHRTARWTAAFAALSLASVSPSFADDSADEPRATMHRIFEALATLLPASLDLEGFGDPAQRAALLARMDTLTGAAQALESHASNRDVSFRFLSRSLARDAVDMRHRFADGQVEPARYLLFELTHDCIACHSRLPSAREFPLAQRMLDRVEIADLGARERARLQVATRQFQGALATWESVLTDLSVPAVDLDVGGELLDYLTVAIRVEREPERARHALTAFASRPDLPRYLRRLTVGWARDLAALRGELAAEPSLARARDLVERAQSLSRFPAGRERVVHDLVASSLLYRTLDAARSPGPELAEALFLQGVIGARTLESYWVPQTEFHLEAAVRAAPGGPFAEPAYELLEEYLVLGYGGSGGVQLPPDVVANLTELRQLIDTAAAAQAGAAPAPVSP